LRDDGVDIERPVSDEQRTRDARIVGAAFDDVMPETM
jgi:hypothetical protein